MNQFQQFQDALEKMFPSLTVFSDLEWKDVFKEYLASHDTRPTDLEEFVFNFPTYLQEKAVAGDSPVYLFELAFYELLQNQILVTDPEFPTSPGIHLNPSLSFLNLEYDVNLMIDEATKGSVQVILRPHILCLYRHPELGFNHLDITTPILEILQTLEKGPVKSRSQLPLPQQKIAAELIKLGILIENTL